MEESLKAEVEELRIVNFCVDYPISFLCISYLIMLILTVISINAGQFAFSDTNDRDYLVWSDPIIKTFDMHSLARSALTAQIKKPAEEIALQSESAMWSI